MSEDELTGLGLGLDREQELENALGAVLDLINQELLVSDAIDDEEELEIWSTIRRAAATIEHDSDLFIEEDQAGEDE